MHSYIVIILLILSFVMTAMSAENLMCEVVGTCLSCRDDEADNEYCKETGRRIRIHCRDNESEFDDYKSCDRTAEDDQLRVILFQVSMAFMGGIAYWGVQRRKKNVMTLFDHRKIRFVRAVSSCCCFVSYMCSAW